MKLRTKRFHDCSRPQHAAAFTLIEVVVASAILVVGLAGILMICTNGLRTVRILDRVHVDAGSLAAMLSQTNRLQEGQDFGDFGETYPGYRWTREVRETATNGLFQVDFLVYSTDGPRGTESRMTVMLYRPDSERKVGR